METTNCEDENLTIQLTFCRICAVLSTDEYGIYENDFKDGTSSLHMMLEKLVPSVFNAEQVKVDELMGFPRKICIGCKGKVLEAYTLYEMSTKSGDLLRKCLSSKKNTTFIVNITGGSMETSEEDTSGPQKIRHVPVRIWNKSQETIVRVTSAKKLPTQEYCKEQMIVKSEDTCPMPVDDQVNPSEIEDLPSYSGEEYDAISFSKASDETYEIKQPLKRQTKADKQKEIVDQPMHSGKDHDTMFYSKDCDETYEIKTTRKRVVTKRQKKGKVVNTSTEKQKTASVSVEESDEPKVKLNQLRCLLCNESTYALPNKLTEHLKMSHMDQIHCCEQCPKVFITKPAFEHHQYCHATGRSYFCVFCDKGFQAEQLLRNHLKTHTDGTGFLCSQCGKEFSDRSNLRQHEYRHTGHKPWQCNLCPSRFSTKGYLTVHLLTHSKNKAYSCDTCGSQFNRHYSLVKHQVIHTGVRHYECEVCKTKFASAHHVKIHMRTHTGEKPYKCGCCERGFAQKNDMLKHMITHGKPYPCDGCDASFMVIADLRIHLKVHEREGKSGNECPSAEQ